MSLLLLTVPTWPVFLEWRTFSYSLPCLVKATLREPTEMQSKLEIKLFLSLDWLIFGLQIQWSIWAQLFNILVYNVSHVIESPIRDNSVMDWLLSVTRIESIFVHRLASMLSFHYLMSFLISIHCIICTDGHFVFFFYCETPKQSSQKQATDKFYSNTFNHVYWATYGQILC